jgi:hypothetical protein
MSRSKRTVGLTHPELHVEGLAVRDARELADRELTQAVQELLAAAEQRDALADARDAAAARRDQALDLAGFLAKGDYGNDWPLRRGAALDRERAKDDRAAARRDRIALGSALLEPDGVPLRSRRALEPQPPDPEAIDPRA